MAACKRDAQATVVGITIVAIEAGVLHVPPVICQTITGQVILCRAEETKVERIAIAAELPQVVVVNVLAYVLGDESVAVETCLGI